MLHTAIATATATPLGPDRSRDYELIRRAIAFLSETWTEQPSLERLAAASGSQPRALPEAVQALVRAQPQGIRAGDHRRPRAQPARRLGQRARRGLRGRPVRRQPAARSVRLARGHDARRLQAPRRGPGDGLRLPRLAVRRGAADGDRARPRRPGLRRRGQGADAAGGARRHDAALAEGAATSRRPRRRRRMPAQIFKPPSGARSSPCAWS